MISESHRHGRLARLVLANTDWLLIRDCPCALWFVRSKALPRSPRLLVAVDPRHAHAKPARLDDRLLQAAQGFTRQLGGRIAVVHAYERFEDVVPGALRRPLRPRQPSPEARRFAATTAELITKLAGKYDVSADECAVRDGAADEVVRLQLRQESVMKVADYSAKVVVSIFCGADVAEAARLMRDQHVGFLVVYREGDDLRRPIGVLTDRDIVLEVTVCGVDPRSVTVEDVMTREPLVARDSDELSDVLRHGGLHQDRTASRMALTRRLNQVAPPRVRCILTR